MQTAWIVSVPGFCGLATGALHGPFRVEGCCRVEGGHSRHYRLRFDKCCNSNCKCSCLGRPRQKAHAAAKNANQQRYPKLLLVRNLCEISRVKSQRAKQKLFVHCVCQSKIAWWRSDALSQQFTGFRADPRARVQPCWPSAHGKRRPCGRMTPEY